ncbi:glycosyltransferase family 2 protein [Colwellia sp. RSH04]|uniref:glycosyltransferase family 2 protein n=1 Tax=Colwellia sp. RSH04 TaxID=2305464 RepID=UPI000E5907A2|nr:glycosyltransferase family 2 protein [Colwellia sp. RSH04]RHW74889.1 glycosyltransferase family 2 protein [Colwellia sp. RSH04]
MASYNGEKYIEQQIKSILLQKNIVPYLIIRDDGSSDTTVKKISLMKELFNSERIELIVNRTSSKGHVRNFSALCQLSKRSEGEYFCFSDQDDVWLDSKLEKLTERMKFIEDKHGKTTPILIHSDLTVVDERLNLISPSFINFQGIPDPTTHEFPTFCLQNVATGCTMMFNRALLDISSPIPDTVLVHDWWFAQCAKLFGVLEFYDEPLIKYRQHSHNSIGALSHKEQRSFFKSHIYKAFINYTNHLESAIKQAESLVNLAENSNEVSFSEESYKHILKFSKLKDVSVINRYRYAKDYFNDKGILERLFMCLAFIRIKRR